MVGQPWPKGQVPDTQSGYFDSHPEDSALSWGKTLQLTWHLTLLVKCHFTHLHPICWWNECKYWWLFPRMWGLMQNIHLEQMWWLYSGKATTTFDIYRSKRETVCITTLVLPQTFPVSRHNLAHKCTGLQEFGESFLGGGCVLICLYLHVISTSNLQSW